MKKVYIETMGCQMNKADTERMLGMLSHFGYEETNEPKISGMLKNIKIVAVYIGCLTTA